LPRARNIEPTTSRAPLGLCDVDRERPDGP
jgi:hypothetical protein